MIGYPKPAKRRKKPNKKRSEKQIAKDAAWKAFSTYIRTRDALKTTGGTEYCRCITCNRVKPYKKTHAGHGIGGRTNSVLFHEQIVNGQCDYCNVFKSGNYEIYASVLINKYGAEKYQEFVALKKVALKYSAQDYREVERIYKEKTKKLLK